jgi:hypothetical protein
MMSTSLSTNLLFYVKDLRPHVLPSNELPSSLMEPSKKAYRTYQLEEGLPQFNTDFAVDALFSLLILLECPHTPLPPLLAANKPYSRLCCHAFPMLLRPVIGHDIW